MSSIIDLFANWAAAAFGVESLIGSLTSAPQLGVSGGKPKATKHGNVFIEEVPLTSVPRSSTEIGEIKWEHAPIRAAWGQTRCKATLQYSTPVAKDATYALLLINVRLDADIKLKPKSEFKSLKDFAPLYGMLMSAPYSGDREMFAAAMSNQVVPEYNGFGTVNGVLFHELLHVSLAKIFADQLRTKTMREWSGQTFGTQAEASAAMLAAAEKVWAEWRGQLQHDAAFLDERFIWEKECLYYIKEYEAAGKPGYSK